MTELENGGNVLGTLSSFSEVCEEIRCIMSDVVASKPKNTDNKKVSKPDVNELRIQGSFHFLSLKQLNRSAQIRGKKVKDRTVEAKQKLDEYNLQLQNLQYEINHLNKEITKCLEFRSRHDDVALVPIQHFYKEAPATISKENETKGDEHKQTLARLDWELETRIKLADKLKTLKRSKEEVLEEIGIKKQHLQTLVPGLQNLLKSSLPLQEALNLPIEQVRRQHELAKLLPRPLFVLFLQSKAFEEACEPSMEVNIYGDEELAEKIHQMAVVEHKSSVVNGDKQTGDDSDSDREEQDEDSGRRKRTASKDKMEVRGVAVDDGISSQHPLFVVISIKTGKEGSVLKLRFSYLTKLKFVVVKSELGSSLSENVVQNSPFLEDDKFLRCVTPKDYGVTCPNPAALFLLGDSPGALGELFEKVGRPFTWAQQLCGLDFLTKEIPKQGSDMQVSFTHMKKIIRQLKVRVSTRLKLSQQVVQFNNNNIICPDDVTALLPSKIHSTLASWTNLTIQEYEGLPFNKTVVELGLHGERPSGEHHYFLAVLKRGTDVKLNVGVVVFNDYPTTTPLFTLELNWKGVKTAENDPNLMEMQLRSNLCDKQDSNRSDLLSIQLLRLSAMLDVYVESDIAPPTDFHVDNFFPKTARGRARIKPFSYDAKMKLFQH